tara:strand:+ start:265 stop:456 length:192 start_codon:yes stop_codon:yes gene_type:complete
MNEYIVIDKDLDMVEVKDIDLVKAYKGAILLPDSIIARHYPMPFTKERQRDNSVSAINKKQKK